MILVLEFINETSTKVTIHPDISKIIQVRACCFSVSINSTPFHFQKRVVQVIIYMLNLFMKHPKKASHKSSLDSILPIPHLLALQQPSGCSCLMLILGNHLQSTSFGYFCNSSQSSFLSLLQNLASISVFPSSEWFSSCTLEIPQEVGAKYSITQTIFKANTSRISRSKIQTSVFLKVI